LISGQNKCIEIEAVQLLDIQSKAKYFTSVNSNLAYHQIPLAKSSKPLTAFCRDWILYQCTLLPFDFAMEARVLSRHLDRIFQDLRFDFVYRYLEDMVLYSESFESHLEYIRLVLYPLRSAGLTVKREKVVFGTQEISFLWHLVSPAGVRIDSERTRLIREFPAQLNTRGISRFMGTVNFYHKFILWLADLATPLNTLRKKSVKFAWGQEQQEAFKALKQATSQPPVLRVVDLSKIFFLTNGCEWCRPGAVISQDCDGVKQPIEYASRTLSAQGHTSSSTYELECLSVFWYRELEEIY